MALSEEAQMRLIQSLTPDEIEQLTSAGFIEPTLAQATLQGHMGAPYAQEQMPQGQVVPHGGQVLPVSPLAAANTGLRQQYGRQQEQEALQRMTAALMREQNAKSLLAQKLQGAYGQVQVPQNPPATPGLGLDLNSGQQGTPATPGLGLDLRSLFGGK